MKAHVSPGDRLSNLLPDSSDVQPEQVRVGGVDLASLAERFGTPLYVYDETTLRRTCREAIQAFRGLGARISFASKSCETVAILAVIRSAGLDLDVVSEGELAAGLRAGFEPQQIHLHGNCKTESELRAAIRLGLRAIVVDNLDELRKLIGLASDAARAVPVMIRVTLPLEAQTHPHLQTSGYRSKFGFYRGSDEERAALQLLASAGTLSLIGLHTHLGSQISDLSIYADAARELVRVAQSVRAQGFPIGEVSLGGGWAVAYRHDDTALSPDQVAEAIAPSFRGGPFRLAVEPGRALVARAGLALYRVGSVKHLSGNRIIAVDGGMGDNPRPALYGARYEPFALRTALEHPIGPATVVGRYCESGDTLAHDISLPDVVPGDLLCFPSAGAYQLSMASAYNLVPPPAVVLVSRGRARLIVRRATVEDLLAREIM